MCVCLDTIKKWLEEHHKSEVALSTKMTIDTASLSLSGEAIPPLY
jgi:hypothetical protein